MADDSSPDYKLRLKQLEKRYEQEKSQRKQTEERQKQAEERQKQAEERTRRTTFVEFLRHSHNLLFRPLRIKTLSRSTTGKIPLSKGKFCPTRLRP